MLLQTTNKSSDYNSSSSLDESNSEIMLQPTKSTCLRKTLNQNISSSTTNNNIERCEFISAEPEIEENNSFSEEEDELIPNVSNISPIAPSQSPQPTTIQEKEKNLSNNSLLNSSNKRKNSHSIRMEEEGDDNEEISLPSPPSIIEENDNDNSSNNKTRNSKTRNESKRNSIKKNLTSHFESVADEDDLENISFTTTGSTTGRKRGRPSKSTTLSNKKLTTDKTPTKDSKKKKNKNKSNTSYLSYSSFTLDDDNDKTIDNDESDNDYSYRSPNITTNDEESILSLPETSINDDDDDKLVNKRTPRKRFPPLQYWKGEHLFISKSKVEKVKYGVETPEKKYIIYHHIKYRKRRIEKNNKGIKKEKVKIEPCEYPSDVEEDDPYYHNFIIYDENNNESRSRTRFRSDSSNVKTINDMTISNGIKLKDSFTCGIIKLKPKSIKPKERLSHSTIVMYVVSCQENSLVLTIEKKKYLLNEEDSFYIPSNLPYSIDNRSEKQEAVIQFTLIMNKNNNS